jgi:hypothetical protein
LGNRSEFQGSQEEHGDYVFSVGRDCNGNVWGLRRLLNGDKLDMMQPPEVVERDNLPSETLRIQYDTLVAGVVPSVPLIRQSGKPIPVKDITNYGLGT